MKRRKSFQCFRHAWRMFFPTQPPRVPFPSRPVALPACRQTNSQNGFFCSPQQESVWQASTIPGDDEWTVARAKSRGQKRVFETFFSALELILCLPPYPGQDSPLCHCISAGRLYMLCNFLCQRQVSIHFIMRRRRRVQGPIRRRRRL